MLLESDRLRTEYLTERLTPTEFVDSVLESFKVAPMPTAGLVAPGKDYLPSSLTFTPAIGKRFRGLAWDLIERSTRDTPIRRRVLAAVEDLLNRAEGEIWPGRLMRECADAEIVEIYCELVRIATGVDDPYKEVKAEFNARALPHLESMGEQVGSLREIHQRFKVAASLGIIGNAIDFADPLKKAHLETHGFDVQQEFQKAEHLTYAQGLDARDAFLAKLRSQSNQMVLFLVDNAGEIVFDLPLIRLLLEQGFPVVLAGKHVACYNDMTTAELKELMREPLVRKFFGIHLSYLTVIDSGTRMIGCDLRRATLELREYWTKAGVVYAKGQGMLQTLRYAPLMRDVFHAVQVKDPAYFHEGVELKAGDALFLHTIPKE